MMSPLAQCELGIREWERLFRKHVDLSGSERFFVCRLWQQQGCTENYSSSGCISWDKVCSLSPCTLTWTHPCHDRSRGCAAPGQHGSYFWASAATWLHLLPFSSPPSQEQAAAITGHAALGLERRKKICCLLWKAFTTPFCDYRSHTKDNLCHFFSDPYSDICPGLIPILLAANTGTLSFLGCSLLSHGYPSKINYLQQTSSLQYIQLSKRAPI